MRYAGIGADDRDRCTLRHTFIIDAGQTMMQAADGDVMQHQSANDEPSQWQLPKQHCQYQTPDATTPNQQVFISELLIPEIISLPLEVKVGGNTVPRPTFSTIWHSRPQRALISMETHVPKPEDSFTHGNARSWATKFQP